MHRRIFLFLLLTFITLLGAGCSGSKSTANNDATDKENPFKGETLNVLSWEGYQEDDWVKPFEKKYGVKINVTYAGSVDEMFAKVASGSVTFDIIFMDGGSVPRYQKMDMIQPIDMEKLKNSSNLIENLKALNDDHVILDGESYALPFTWASLPMMVNADEIKEPIDSWSALWDEKYAGKIVTLDDSSNQVAMTALLLGISDPYNLSDEELEKVKQKLIEQKPLVRSYYAGYEDGKNLMASGEGLIGYTMGPSMITDLQKQGMNIVEVIPKEGAIVWIDNAVIGKKVKNLDLVYTYLDYLISEDVQVQFVRKTGFGGVSSKAADMLTEEEKKMVHMDDPDYFKDLVYMAFPESFEKRVELWNEVKAAN
ncbi:ABC transporter substrate-binding protein [Lederbergia citrea]|uniref:ABC transporter substrate-binding protein n=1 Tax=Lederbergia citrea TaxID=2833581 RepID=UPI001BC99A5A|nr:extracellular solute-binding protein [Lederbergia citrea]MBS4178800.1 extracellular solute-binding protein [Lederbergia citrea]